MIWINSYEKETDSDMCKCSISIMFPGTSISPKETEILLPIQEVQLCMWKKLMVEQKKLTVDDVHKLEAHVDEVIEYYISLHQLTVSRDILNLIKKDKDVNNEM